MSIQAIITLSVIAFSLVMLVQFVIGYLAGWRAGHLTGIEYAMKIWLSGAYVPPANKAMTEYTADVIKDNAEYLAKIAEGVTKQAQKARPQSVKDETRQQIEELRKSGLK